MAGPVRHLPTLAALLLAAPALGAPRPLTPEERAGRQVYLTGESPSGGAITAMVGGVGEALPGSAMTCAGCHGEDGLGRPEGGVRPSVVTWSHLTTPHGHVHDDGRRHPPFDERSLALAITDGVDPAGRPLDVAMPRYGISRSDLQALVAWIRRLEEARAPGVAEAALRLGTVLPGEGPLEATGGTVRAVLEAAFEALNRGGGINGRRVELVVERFAGGRDGAVAAARRLIETGDVFALVSGLAPQAEAELAELADERGIPLVGPCSLRGPAVEAAGGPVFWLLAGLPEQARVLVDQAAEAPGLDGAPFAVVREDRADLDGAAGAGEAQARRRGWRTLPGIRVAGDGGAAAGAARAGGAQVVLFLGGDEALRAFLGRAAADGWRPWVLVPGALAARAALAAPPALDGRILLAFPVSRADETEAARAALARSAPAGEGPGAHAAAVQAQVAAAVLAEGLRRAGRHLTRARLVTALEGVARLETGLVPPIRYGPGRRVGAAGAHVVAADLSARTFRPLGGFRRLD